MSTTSTTSVTLTAPVAAPDLRTTTTTAEPQGNMATKAAAQPAPPPQAPPEPAKLESQLKLVVAKSEESLAYSYTLVDQVTGRVVAEIPHQAAEAAAANPNYAAGGVVDTLA